MIRLLIFKNVKKIYWIIILKKEKVLNVKFDELVVEPSSDQTWLLILSIYTTYLCVPSKFVILKVVLVHVFSLSTKHFISHLLFSILENSKFINISLIDQIIILIHNFQALCLKLHECQVYAFNVWHQIFNTSINFSKNWIYKSLLLNIKLKV